VEIKVNIPAEPASGLRNINQARTATRFSSPQANQSLKNCGLRPFSEAWNPKGFGTSCSPDW
jgi:hypothetical protein